MNSNKEYSKSTVVSSCLQISQISKVFQEVLGVFWCVVCLHKPSDKAVLHCQNSDWKYPFLGFGGFGFVWFWGLGFFLIV